MRALFTPNDDLTPLAIAAPSLREKLDMAGWLDIILAGNAVIAANRGNMHAAAQYITELSRRPDNRGKAMITAKLNGLMDAVLAERGDVRERYVGLTVTDQEQAA